MIVVVQDAGMESDDNKPFYEEDEEEEEVEKNKKPVFKLLLDQDHKLLLRNAKPLLQSRNASVSYQSLHCKYTYKYNNCVILHCSILFKLNNLNFKARHRLRLCLNRLKTADYGFIVGKKSDRAQIDV